VEAKREFAELSPGLEITKAGVRDRRGDRVIVFIQYLHAGGPEGTSETNIWETVLLYEKRDGQWRPYQISYNYVGPVP